MTVSVRVSVNAVLVGWWLCLRPDENEGAIASESAEESCQSAQAAASQATGSQGASDSAAERRW